MTQGHLLDYAAHVARGVAIGVAIGLAVIGIGFGLRYLFESWRDR